MWAALSLARRLVGSSFADAHDSAGHPDAGRLKGSPVAPVAIVVHGGAWDIPDSLRQPSLDGCTAAAAAGYKVLATGGSAVDAVEAAVRVLEDDPAFDAGTGSVLNAAGVVECDALILDGANHATGAVAALQETANPISVARSVPGRLRADALT